jgi:Zn-finger nucleic acid-binding protein
MTTDIAPFSCPRCGLELFVGRAPEVTMHGCGRCGGIWLDNENTQVALKGMSPPAKEMLSRITSNATTEVDKASAIMCPSCHKALDRVDRAGITLDLCNEHGTWFDRTELYRLVDAMAPKPVPPMPPMPQFAPSYPAAYPVSAGPSGLAIAGFICSFFCGLLGLVLSIMAINQINRSNGHIGGRGFSTAGIIISVLSMMLGLLMNLGR